MTPLILLKKQEVSEEVTLRVRKAWLKRHIVYITDNMSATGDKQCAAASSARAAVYLFIGAGAGWIFTGAGAGW